MATKNDLESRMAIAKQRVDVATEIRRLAEKANIDAAKRLTDTTGITRKASELTNAHVTSLVRDRFTRESDRLRLERIELKKTGGQKGKLRHRPALLGAKTPKPVPQVLSEGEQTALGLAGYFTEAFFDDSRSALVVVSQFERSPGCLSKRPREIIGRMTGPRRPRDSNQLAKLIVDLATGEAEEGDIADPERSAKQRGGRVGGKARAKALTPERRSAIARKAARSRWSKREQG